MQLMIRVGAFLQYRERGSDEMRHFCRPSCAARRKHVELLARIRHQRS
jgi:hypothetical protein